MKINIKKYYNNKNQAWVSVPIEVKESMLKIPRKHWEVMNLNGSWSKKDYSGHSYGAVYRCPKSIAHIMDGDKCWCNPTIIKTSGSDVVLHNEVDE